MSHLKYLLVTFLLIISFCSNGQTLVIKVTNIKVKKPIRIALYNVPSDFPKEDKKWKEKEVIPTETGAFLISFVDIPKGTYAIALFQDNNQNQKIDTNLIGYPTEPFGFSNNFKPKFSAPDFNDCKIDFNSNTNIFTINLLD